MEVWIILFGLQPQPGKEAKTRESERSGKCAIWPVYKCERCKGGGGDVMVGWDWWLRVLGGGKARGVEAYLDGILAWRVYVKVGVYRAGRDGDVSVNQEDLSRVRPVES